MINFFSNVFKVKNRGFSFIEIIISITIFSLILLVAVSFLFSMDNSNAKTKADREASDNAKSVLEKIIYEIRSAKSIYTPTTATSQLSLETSRYLPNGENISFVDFFMCGSSVCLKKESQNPIALNSNSVQVTNLEFLQISTGLVPSEHPSIQVNLTVSSGSVKNFSSVSLTSTASLRSY